MESALRPVLVVGTALAVTLAVGYAVDRSLRAVDARHPETPLWHLLRRCRLPLQVTICSAMLRGGYRAAHAYLTLRLLGYPRVRNYVGSWKEWGDREELPIQT